MTESLPYAYMVCDNCGALWAVDEDEPDPTRCNRAGCRSKAFWRFKVREHAVSHAETVKVLAAK